MVRARLLTVGVIVIMHRDHQARRLRKEMEKFSKKGGMRIGGLALRSIRFMSSRDESWTAIDDGQVDAVRRPAPRALHLKPREAAVDSLPYRRRWLCRAAIAPHSFIPTLACGVDRRRAKATRLTHFGNSPSPVASPCALMFRVE
jgi:hypothetical protein